MKKLMFLLFQMTLAVVLPLAAFAADAAAILEPGGFSHVADDFFRPLATGLVSILVPLLITLLCRFLTKLTGINVSQASQQKLESIAEKAVLAVEEKAQASLKKAGEKWVSSQKHKEALNHVMLLAPSLSQEQADLLVHWAVAKIPGLGATETLGGANGADDAGGTAAAAQGA